MSGDDLSLAVKSLAHPIRRGVVSGMAQGVTTPADLAVLLEQPLGVVSYHVRMLRDYGVIEVERTEPRRGALQHFYRFTDAAVQDFEEVAATARSAARWARKATR